MKIEVGGGENPRRPDWIQADVRRGPTTRFVCDAWTLDDHVEEGTVEATYSRHVFEHFTYSQGLLFVRCMHKILKQGGTVEIICPNMDFHIAQWVKKKNIPGTLKCGWKKHAIAGLYGFQRDGETLLWDVHKAGYTNEMLRDVFTDNGFSVLKQFSGPLDRDLHFIFAKLVS